MADNIHPIFERLVSRSEKEKFLNQKAKVFWFTGLSGSGKSTIAEAVERQLFNAGHFVQVLDGDNIRTGISSNLDFSLEGRKENIRRIAEVSKLMVNAGVICLNSFVSPTKEIRDYARSIIGPKDFHLIYINASIEACEKRDVKGLYRKARAGLITGFTGIDSPFEEPVEAQLTIDTVEEALNESTEKVLRYVLKQVSP